MTEYQRVDCYRSVGVKSQALKYKQPVPHGFVVKYNSGSRCNKQSKMSYDSPSMWQQNFEDAQQLKSQNQRLKKSLKQSNAKRSSLAKQCSEYQKHIQQLQTKIQRLVLKVDEQKTNKEGDKYRVEQLNFLNKQLSGEVNVLRDQNQALVERARYCSEVVQRKYQELQQKMMRRMQQAMKRVKQSVHYLQTLSMKDIEKTKQILVVNLRKANELLKGKDTQQTDVEYQIQQLMNPLKSVQEQLALKNRQLNLTKNQITKLSQQVRKHKRIQQQLLPQYKQSIWGLKKNLARVRAQLTSNEMEKMHIKNRCHQKTKAIEHQYSQLLIECRRNKVQKKIFENKLEQLQQEKEQEKQRLLGENRILKKLYDNKRRASKIRQVQLQNQNSNLDQSLDQQIRREKQIRKTTSFKKNKYQQNKDQSYIFQDQSNLDDCKSADYYNSHKTNKENYGGQLINQKRPITKNASFKELRNLGQNNHRMVSKQEDQRANNLRNNNNLKQMTDSAHDFKKSRTRNHSRHKQPQQIQKAKSSKQKQRQDQGHINSNKHQNKSDEQQEQQYEFAEPDSQHQVQDTDIIPLQDTSMTSQQSLINQICKIDQEIIQIQKNLTKQLQAYK